MKNLIANNRIKFSVYWHFLCRLVGRWNVHSTQMNSDWSHTRSHNQYCNVSQPWELGCVLMIQELSWSVCVWSDSDDVTCVVNDNNIPSSVASHRRRRHQLSSRGDVSSPAAAAAAESLCRTPVTAPSSCENSSLHAPFVLLSVTHTHV